ncbi:MAG TPA: GNAT family protein [Gemmataceae bacterium]|jgi:RimJ/RimL family protein N-acetyltransferase|nr:GNAT family protein [Gemmataceae bacterium]
MKAPFAVGRQVYVRALARADLPAMVEWINDTDVTRLLYTGDRPAHLELLEEQWAIDQRSQRDIVFAVCNKSDDAFIGTTGLYLIHWVMRTAEFRIFLGAKQYWNRGIGTECTRLMVVYGFDKLNLNRIYLGVNAENTGGVKAYERAGFVREGVHRQEQYRNFRYYDVIRMGLLRSEYEQIRDGYLTRGGESGGE